MTGSLRRTFHAVKDRNDAFYAFLASMKTSWFCQEWWLACEGDHCTGGGELPVAAPLGADGGPAERGDRAEREREVQPVPGAAAAGRLGAQRRGGGPGPGGRAGVGDVGRLAGRGPVDAGRPEPATGPGGCRAPAAAGLRRG